MRVVSGDLSSSSSCHLRLPPVGRGDLLSSFAWVNSIRAMIQWLGSRSASEPTTGGGLDRTRRCNALAEMRLKFRRLPIPPIQTVGDGWMSLGVPDIGHHWPAPSVCASAC